MPQADFLSAVNTQFTFTASGGGWIVQKIVKLDVKFPIFNPNRGSSYIPTLPELNASRLLLNIRNRQDHNRFLYCFSAAWHLKHESLLYVAGRATLRNRTCPQDNSRRNPLAHQAGGKFDMPMSLGQMLRFEKLNDCKINVFRYNEKQLVFLRVTRENGDGLEIAGGRWTRVSLHSGTGSLEASKSCQRNDNIGTKSPLQELLPCIHECRHIQTTLS